MNNSNNGLNINGFAIHQMTCQGLTVDNILYLEELYKHLIIIIIIFFFLSLLLRQFQDIGLRFTMWCFDIQYKMLTMSKIINIPITPHISYVFVYENT